MLVLSGWRYVSTRKPSPVAENAGTATSTYPYTNRAAIEKGISEGKVSGPYPFYDFDNHLHVLNSDYQLVSDAIKSGAITIGDIEDVQICGGTYKSKRILIDGVNLLKRALNLVGKDSQKSEALCDYLNGLAEDTGGKINENGEIQITLGEEKSTEQGAVFRVGINLGRSIVHIQSGIPHGYMSGFLILADPEKNKLYMMGTEMGALK